MSTLLLRLAAPLQAWGVNAKYNRRGTERMPTKSGVIGLVAAALGRRRNDSLEDLQALRFGVRVDQSGVLLRDFHTARSEKAAYVTYRYFLSDAVFLVGLEGDEALLRGIEHALHYPQFPLFLGRRSCPPEGQLSLGIRYGVSLLEALQKEPWLASQRTRWREGPEVRLPISLDADETQSNAYFQRDVPLSFDQTHRRYGFRRVSGNAYAVIKNPDSRYSPQEPWTDHDVMADMEG